VIEGEGLGASPGAEEVNALAVDLFPAVADRASGLLWPDPDEGVNGGQPKAGGGGDGYRELQFQKWGFPELADENLTIGFDESGLNAAAAPWRQWACKLLSNPTAQITLSTIFSEIDNDH
jgi:hypothetical protein